MALVAQWLRIDVGFGGPMFQIRKAWKHRLNFKFDANWNIKYSEKPKTKNTGKIQ